MWTGKPASESHRADRTAARVLPDGLTPVSSPSSPKIRELQARYEALHAITNTPGKQAMSPLLIADSDHGSLTPSAGLEGSKA